MQQLNNMDEVCYESVLKQVKAGHQVHRAPVVSRKCLLKTVEFQYSLSLNSDIFIS
jgi:hypothetical protein